MKAIKFQFMQLLHNCALIICVLSLLSWTQITGAANELISLPQSKQEIRPLLSGNPVEREIAGRQSHIYQITLAAGQFVHFRLEQRAIDAALILTAPDGKQMAEMDLTKAGEPESISVEAMAGSYQLIVRGIGTERLRGSYRLEVVAQAAATEQDRKRLRAESLLSEASYLWKEGADTPEPSLEKGEQALSLWRELSEPSLIVAALNLMGDVYSDTGEYEKAIGYYQQAITICRDFGLRTREALTLHNLALCYQGLEEIEKEFANLEQALTIFRELKDKSGEAIALISLGVTYYGMELPEKAIEVTDQALAITRELKDRRREVSALNNLSAYYGVLYREDKEIEYLEQALAVNRLEKDQLNQHQSLHNMASIYKSQGQTEKAIEYYQQALAIARELKNPMRQETTLSAMGEAYAELKYFDKAIACYEQSLAIARAARNRISECHTLRVFGVAYNLQRQSEKARTYLDQALAISREMKSLIYEMFILADLARTENDRGNLEQARLFIEESLRIAEALRARRDSFASSSAFFTSVQTYYELYTQVLMHQHKAEPTKGLDALALEVSERQRARSLLDQLVEARINFREGADPELIERERLVGRQLNNKAQTEANTPEQAATLKREISQLETELEKAQVDIRKANPHYAALVRPQPLKFKEIQQQLDDGTLLLEYALGDERSYLWAITKDSLASYELPKKELINQSALQVYELLTARSASKRGESVLQRRNRIAQAESKLPNAAAALSQILLSPVAAELGNKRLVIVADGALQYIPFAALPSPSAQASLVTGHLSLADNETKDKGQRTKDNPPLIVNHEIVSLPSASVLAVQRAELAGRQPAPKMLAVIADPVFDRSDARFKTPATDSNNKQQVQTIAFNDARSLEHLAEKSSDKSGVTTRRLIIPRLPFTRQEATQLLALALKTSSFSAMDFQANRDTILNGNLAQYRYVHFATHGLLDSERPGLSSLVLSMVDAQGKTQDGFLRLHDIYNLKLPAELVVLSACQTGLCKDIKGEGLDGLMRGFMYAGAARVVVSLWNVNDKATADLMTKFYEKMLKQGERPSAALRAAQVEMWRQKQWQSPYYWAAFTMQGEWR
jgi:CHAT domain-containing protein/tetratricopeptide (TPR) repeat protein